jgi:hypothetical protein
VALSAVADGQRSPIAANGTVPSREHHAHVGDGRANRWRFIVAATLEYLDESAKSDDERSLRIAHLRRGRCDLATALLWRICLAKVVVLLTGRRRRYQENADDSREQSH